MFTSYFLVVVIDELILVGDHLHLVLDPQVLPEVVAVPEDTAGTQLTIETLTSSFLYICL